MGTGRKLKPTNLKVIEGTFRKDRNNNKQPKLTVSLPDVPQWMLEDAKERFETNAKLLEEMGVVTKADSGIVAQIAMREYEISLLNQDIKSNGYVFIKRDKKGDVVMARANPAVGQRNEALRHLQSLYAECGLTPAARGKVTVLKPDEEEDNPFKPL